MGSACPLLPTRADCVAKSQVRQEPIYILLFKSNRLIREISTVLLAQSGDRWSVPRRKQQLVQEPAGGQRRRRQHGGEDERRRDDDGGGAGDDRRDATDDDIAALVASGCGDCAAQLKRILIFVVLLSISVEVCNYVLLQLGELCLIAFARRPVTHRRVITCVEERNSDKFCWNKTIQLQDQLIHLASE